MYVFNFGWIIWDFVSLWLDKPGCCWFVGRGKHCTMADKPWLKPTSEHAVSARCGVYLVVVIVMVGKQLSMYVKHLVLISSWITL